MIIHQRRGAACEEGEMMFRTRHVLGLLAIATLGVAACGPIRSTTTPLAVSSEAPAFSLPNQEGRQVTLSALTLEGPAVLVFNRGRR